MADSLVPITAGAGTSIDTRTESTNNHHRQVIVIGDPANNTGVAPVDPTSGLTVNVVPVTTGGCATYHAVAAVGANAANIKSAAGQVYGVVLSNRAAYSIYAKLHNSAAVPTPGAGVARTVGAQAGTDVNLTFPRGLTFAAGIAITIVKGIADSDTTSLAAGDCVVDVEYK